MKQQDDPVRWALENCYVLARRRLTHARVPSQTDADRKAWEHVVRLCEDAGLSGHGVLRADVPRMEPTEGGDV